MHERYKAAVPSITNHNLTMKSFTRSLLPRRLVAIASLFTALHAAPDDLRAADLFTITATSTGGAPAGTVSVGGKSVVDLVDNLINASGGFSGFGASDYTAGLNYAGVANAITFTNNIAGTSARLRIPSTGFERQFTGGNRQQVEQQIEDFLKSEGSAELAKFMKAMAARSLVTITDGNPNASTARSASEAFQNYGMTFAETREEKNADKPTGRAGFGIIADVGSFDANGIKGTVYSLPMFARFKLTDRVGLDFNMPLNYTEIEGAKAFGLGLGLGVPVKVIPRAKDSPWYWQLTPFGGANATGSKDLAAGGLLANGGLNSLLSHDFGAFTLSMGNHFSLYEGIPITVSGYKFDPGVSQQMVKNGLKLDVPIGKRWIFDVYAVHTKFLTAAALDQYITVGGEIGYRFLGKPDAAKKSGGYLKLGLYADVGDNYTSAHAQFGSGWKF